MSDNPLDALPPPSANPLDTLAPPPADPMTLGRAAGLTGRGVATGVTGAVAAPFELNSLGHSLMNKIGSAMTGNKDYNTPIYPLDSTPLALPSRVIRMLLQRYAGTDSPTAAVNTALTQAGVAAPQTPGQRMYTAGVAGLTGGALPGGAIGGLRGAIQGGLSGLSGAAAQQGGAELGAGPVTQGALGVAGALLPGAPKLAALSRTARAAPMSAQEVVDQARLSSPQSMGAAAAAPNLANVSPGLQQAVVSAAQRTGGAINPDVLARHIEADSLPVKVQLTEGQATQDPAILSKEMNMRGALPALLARFNEQNGQLTQNMQTLRDDVGPDVFSTNPVEHGDTLIEAYKAKNAAAQANIAQKYQALQDANGGQFPVDAKALLSNATDALHRKLLFEHAPELATLSRLADKGMTFEQFEALRTNLARVMRSSSDGNEIAAAGVIRNEMENLPLQGGSENLKPLADAARSAAKAQFDALRADPAYNAAVTDSVPADRFVQRFIVGAPRDDVATMRANLAANPAATQTMGVAALDHLRNAAGVDLMGNGNFSQAGFNRNLQALSPKLSSLVGPRVADQLETLGNVARYTQAQPRGSFVNNSNTFVANAADYGKGALEGAANVAAHGVPVGTWIRKGVQRLGDAKTVRQATAPGAGLSQLTARPSLSELNARYAIKPIPLPQFQGNPPTGAAPVLGGNP